VKSFSTPGLQYMQIANTRSVSEKSTYAQQKMRVKKNRPIGLTTCEINTHHGSGEVFVRTTTNRQNS